MFQNNFGYFPSNKMNKPQIQKYNKKIYRKIKIIKQTFLMNQP